MLRKLALTVLTLSVVVATIQRRDHWDQLQVFHKVKNNVRDIWKNCTKPGIFNITQVTITPDPPRIGDEVNIIVGYNLSETIDSGKIKLDLVLVNMPLDTEVDLCQTLPSVGLQCPLYKGYNQIWNITQKIPNDAPTGEYKGTVSIQKSDGTQLACIQLDFTM